MSTRETEARVLERRCGLWLITLTILAVITALLLAEVATEVGQEWLPFRVGWSVVVVFVVGILACIWKMYRLFGEVNEFSRR